MIEQTVLLGETKRTLFPSYKCWQWRQTL